MLCYALLGCDDPTILCGYIGQMTLRSGNCYALLGYEDPASHCDYIVQLTSRSGMLCSGVKTQLFSATI